MMKFCLYETSTNRIRPIYVPCHGYRFTIGNKDKYNFYLADFVHIPSLNFAAFIVLKLFTVTF